MFAKTTKEIAGYVGRTYKYSGDIRLVVENLEMVAIDMPKDPPEGATRTENRIWEKEVDEHVKWTAYLKKNICTLYSLLVWGQCSDIVQQRVEAMDTFGQMSTTGDGLMLLRAIKDVTYNFQSQKYLQHLLYESKRRFYILFQGRTTATQAYLEQFQNMIDVIQHSGGIIGEDSGVEKMILGKKSKDNLSEAELIDLKEEINKLLSKIYNDDMDEIANSLNLPSQI